MATSQQILDLIGRTRVTPMSQGRAQSVVQSGKPGAAVRRFGQALREVPVASGPRVVHPATQREARGYVRESDELTPAELMWLQRLPLDPAQVTHDDAARLAGMAASISRSKSPSSYQLVQSVWAPVRELHDLAAARERAELARSPLPPVPGAAAEALAEALMAEHEDWPESAARARADELIAQRLQRRDREHGARIAQAEAELTGIEAAMEARTALAREVSA